MTFKLEEEYRSRHAYFNRSEARREIIDKDVIPNLVLAVKKIVKYLSKAKADYIEYMSDASLGVGY